MVISPKIRGFICTAAHPMGRYELIKEQIEWVKSQDKVQGPKRVLIIGGSTGYGLATALVFSFAGDAAIINVSFEKPASGKRTASPGWYNNAIFEKFSHEEGRYAKSINGDAFSNEIKQKTAELIRKDLKKIDCLVYSLASPVRVHPTTSETFRSVLKPIGQEYNNKTVEPFTEEVKEVVIEPATEKEINDTVAVMGGEDWRLWIEFLKKENLLADNFLTFAYSYIGPELTHAIYKNGTIGQAKEHLQKTASELNDELKSINGRALISVNKAIVTQASAAIPVVPLYISILYKVMKEQGTHEDAIQQIYRLCKEKLFSGKPIELDHEGRIRIDDWEMEPAVQKEIATIWTKINSENIKELSDIEGYRNEFYKLFGFGVQGINYEEDVNVEMKIPSIDETIVE